VIEKVRSLDLNTAKHILLLLSRFVTEKNYSNLYYYDIYTSYTRCTPTSTYLGIEYKNLEPDMIFSSITNLKRLLVHILYILEWSNSGLLVWL
jgi:hypothetical protein